MPEYSAIELAICTASRILEDGATVGVGTGAPCATAMLAQKRHAPHLLVAFEAGGLAPLLPSHAHLCRGFKDILPGADGDQYGATSWRRASGG